jgi:hypothetical protein
MAEAPKQLLDLPDEILNFVAEAVENGTSLVALARTCRRLQDHAERFIYRSLIIEHGAQAGRLDKAISRPPRRAAVVSKLFVVPSAVATRGIEYIPWMLEKMNCLKNLLIQSPSCAQPSSSESMEDQAQYANLFRRPSLHVTNPSERLLSQLVDCKKRSMEFNNSDRQLVFFAHRLRESHNVVSVVHTK